jgi:ankyrin repeat protein
MDNIFDLIKNKKFDILLEYIKKNENIDLDIYDENYNYIIQYLVMYNEIDILKFILQHRTIRLDILDTDGRNLLYMPIKYNYYELLKILIEYDKKNIGMSILDVRDNNNHTGLHYCIIYDNLKAFLLLYNIQSINNINNNDNNIYNLCLQYKRTNILLFLLENEIKNNTNINNIINNNGESILQSAINYDDMKIIKFIINNTLFLKKIINNKENEYGLTALHQCIVLNYNEIVIKLIENGADINSADYLGNTPLHYSIIEKNYEITEYLLLKMDPKNTLFYSETNMTGNTALHLFLEDDIINSNINSSEGTKHKIFDILLKLIENTDINIINMDGFTSLHYIAIKSLFSIPQIKKILTNGKTHMNLFITNKEGLNVLDMVKTTVGYKDEFINIAIDSYYNILKTMKNNIEPWEQYCANDDLTNLLKVIKGINKHKNNNNNSMNKDTSYYCKDYIKKLILEKKRSIPTYKELNLNLDMGVYMEGCFYTGSTIDILFGLLYLNINIKNSSLLLEYPLTYNKEIENYYIKMGLNYTFKMEFSNIEIVWSFMKLIYPTNFDSILLNRIKQSHSSNMNIIIPLGIEVSNTSNSGSHANIIIIDYENKTIERFEPNGMNPPRGFYYNPSLLNTLLKTKFSNLLPDYTYIPPSEYLPNIGFQMYESIEDTKCKKIGDPNGFCAVWCIWWAEQRLKYNEVKPKKLAEELIKHMKFSNKSFKKLIRNYSINIVKLRDEYLKKYDINIDDWMVGKYDEDMINNLEKNVLEKIN